MRCFARLVRLRDVPAREVAAADVDHLARVDEVLHRLPDLVPRRGAVDVVHLVEVDVIGLQAAQAGVARVADVARREAAVVGPLGHRAVDLRREHDLLAPASALREPAADDRLGRARTLVAAVAVGGVEEVDAVLERAVHDDARVGLARQRPEVHGAETQLAHPQRGTSESAVLHVIALFGRASVSLAFDTALRRPYSASLAAAAHAVLAGMCEPRLTKGSLT